MSRFDTAIALIDEANAADPHGKELLYSQRLSERLLLLEPNASEALRLAARAQHVRRWEIPRDTYPRDRRGYHLWRTALYAFHAETAGTLLRRAGYDDATIARVQSLLRKERLKSDPEMQTLEDAICLVFLEFYLGEFAEGKDEPKLIQILARTWAKMSPRGREAALQLKLPESTLALLRKATAGS
jgi:hypothetical protein